MCVCVWFHICSLLVVLPTLVCVCVAMGEEVGQEKMWGSDSHMEDFGVKGREKVKFVFVFYLSLSINLVIFFFPHGFLSFSDMVCLRMY